MPKGKPYPCDRESYNRMIYVTVSCPEVKCQAQRGEKCTRLIIPIEPTQDPHIFRRWAFQCWGRENPDKYKALVNQVLENSFQNWEEETYETNPA